ncbi:MAG: DNA recombination protein RmuC [Prevotellamassilia sp.]|nr:DNA recombination protein RmuC [Prevotellamassilia sp.]
MMTVIAAAGGLLVGAVASWLYWRGRQGGREAEVAMLSAQLKEVKAEAEKAGEQARRDGEQYGRLALEAQERAHRAALDALENRHREIVAAVEQRWQEMMAKVTAEMSVKTEAMLKARQKEFSDYSTSSIENLMKPLGETMAQMQQAMVEAAKEQSRLGGEMKAGVEGMMRESEAARRSADELARVFRQGSRVQGEWGEVVLDELLQAGGLTRGVHYDTQAVIRHADGTTVKSEEGRRLRPDVILHLDKTRDVVIDSKVSLTAFLDYLNATDDALRNRALRQHVESLQKHVKELAAKDYSSYIRPPKVAMNYVIMFVPNSGALWTALTAQPDLWRRAMEQGVFIADEQTLYAALRIVSLTWTQIAQVSNHEKVFALAGEMLDRVGQFVKKYKAVGKALEVAAKAYDEGDRKLGDTGQSIVQTCRKLQRLGARESDRNPLPPLTEAEQLAATTQMPEADAT